MSNEAHISLILANVGVLLMWITVYSMNKKIRALAEELELTRLRLIEQGLEA